MATKGLHMRIEPAVRDRLRLYAVALTVQDGGSREWTLNQALEHLLNHSDYQRDSLIPVLAGDDR